MTASCAAACRRNLPPLLLLIYCLVVFAVLLVDANNARHPCSSHLLSFYRNTRSGDFLESCWTKYGSAKIVDGRLVLGGQNQQNATGSIWGTKAVSDGILNSETHWNFKMTFSFSNNGSAGLAVWLTTESSRLSEPTNRGIFESGFSGVGILFDVIAASSDPLQPQTGGNRYQLYSVVGVDLHEGIDAKLGSKNQSCVLKPSSSKSASKLEAINFVLTMYKVGAKLYAEMKTVENEAVDCDMQVPLGILMANRGRLPALYLGIAGWSVDSDSTGPFTINKLTSEIREVADSSSDETDVESSANEDSHSNRGHDHHDDDLKKSVRSAVIGSAVLLGLIATIGLIIFLWVCKCELPYCVKKRRHEADEEELPRPIRRSLRRCSTDFCVDFHADTAERLHQSTVCIEEIDIDKLITHLPPIPEFSPMPGRRRS